MLLETLCYRTVMKKKRSQQTNWRLSTGAIKLLREAAKKSGMTKTQVVETCIFQYALSVPELASEARQAVTNALMAKRDHRSFNQPELFQLAGFAE